MLGTTLHVEGVEGCACSDSALIVVAVLYR